jgi:hypothetical protein
MDSVRCLRTRTATKAAANPEAAPTPSAQRGPSQALRAWLRSACLSGTNTGSCPFIREIPQSSDHSRTGRDANFARFAAPVVSLWQTLPVATVRICLIVYSQIVFRSVAQRFKKAQNCYRPSINYLT